MNLLYDSLFGGFRNDPRPFLELGDGTRISYRAFLDRAARFAHALRSQGVEPGDRVATQVEKSADALALYVATLQSGAVFLPLNPAYTPAEVAFFIGDAEPKVLVVDPETEADLRPLAGSRGVTLLTLAATRSGTLPKLADAMPEHFEPEPRTADDLAGILYTSGTTGRAKGAMLSHRNLLSNAQALTEAWQFTARDVLLHALPIFHTHGLFVATNTLALAGGSMLFLPRFDLDQILAALPRVTSMMGVPTFYTRLVGSDRLTRDLVAHIRLFISGSAPLLAETHRSFAERTGHAVLERYGMTETNMITSNPYQGERRAGTVGFPLPGVQVNVTDPETGRPLGPGEVGMIEVRGPNVFKGYWRLPEKTSEDLRANGFFITGDLGTFDADGYLAIVGRSKDLIISGGFNVYPKEVEALIDVHPGVLESAVIGIPHADFGEAVVAVVVCKPGAAPGEDEIREALRAKLARYKQPKRVVFATDLPRNAMGKVQKNQLRVQVAGCLKEPSSDG